MQLIASSLEKLPKDAQKRVLFWANSKFGIEPISVNEATDSKNLVKKVGTAGKSAKKASTSISIDKSLNLFPAGKRSATDFAAEKAPSNAKEKCVVAAYYLREEIELEAVSVSTIYTFFKAVSWKLPADIRNMLAQAGSKGWLDTADGNNIKISPTGENLVEHDLPKKAK